MEQLNNIINTVLIIAIVQGFIFNIIIHFKNKPQNKAIFYLNLTIFVFTINNLQSYLIKHNVLHIPEFIKYSIIDVSWNVFIAPFFFMFLIHYLKIEKHYRYVIETTVSIFIGLIITRLVILTSFNHHYTNSNFIQFMRRYNIYEDIFILLGTIAVFSYCVYLFYKLKNRFKYINSFNNLKWLQTFYRFTALILFLWFIAIVFDAIYINLKTAYIYTPLRLMTSFLIYWLGYQGYHQYLLTSDRISLRTKLKNQQTTSLNKEEKITSDKKDDAKLFETFKEMLKIKDLYLNPLLSLESLAEEVGIHKATLSKLINRYSKNNFTQFINTYRVNYAKRILLDKEYDAYTIISIGLECGFNSKSAFYTSFKGITGKTPSEYRKMKSE